MPLIKLKSFWIFMTTFLLAAVLLAGMARGAWAAERWRQKGTLMIYSGKPPKDIPKEKIVFYKDPEPLTIIWMNGHIKPPDNPYVLQVEYPAFFCAAGKCVYELGLRSDGVVVWRKVEEKEGVK